MKRVLLVVSVFFSTLLSAQIHDPVSWNVSHNKMSENEIELEFKATIEDGWYLYSQYLPVDADAFPTKITFLASQDYELVGETIEPEPIKAFDPNYDMELSYFKEEVIFKQRIKIKTANSFLVNGEISFMSCDDSQCVFLRLRSFSILLDQLQVS